VSQALNQQQLDELMRDTSSYVLRMLATHPDFSYLLTQSKRIKELQAENARLKAEVERLGKLEDYHHDQLNRYALDDMRLTAQVERLTKAGDVMAFHYISLGRKFFPNDPLPPSVTDWNAAKGVQS